MYQLRKNFRLYGIGVGFLLMAYGTFTYQAYFPMLGMILIGLVFLAIPTYRIWRDQRIIRQADKLPTVNQMPVSQNSPGNRLFVPPPKQRQK